MTPPELTLPEISPFPPFTLLVLILYFSFPLSPAPPCLLLFFTPLLYAVFSLSPLCRLLRLPALSVMQLVVLKVWSVGRLVGEGVGGREGGRRGASGSLRSTPKYALLSTQTHKGLLPNKNTLFLISSCAKLAAQAQRHRLQRRRERKELWELLSSLWTLMIG